MSDVELPVAHYKMSHVCICLRREQQSDEYEINYFFISLSFKSFLKQKLQTSYTAFIFYRIRRIPFHVL